MGYCFQGGVVNVEDRCGSECRDGLVDYLSLLHIDLKTDGSVCGSYHVEGMLQGLGGVSDQQSSAY